MSFASTKPIIKLPSVAQRHDLNLAEWILASSSSSSCHCTLDATAPKSGGVDVGATGSFGGSVSKANIPLYGNTTTYTITPAAAAAATDNMSREEAAQQQQQQVHHTTLLSTKKLLTQCRLPPTYVQDTSLKISIDKHSQSGGAEETQFSNSYTQSVSCMYCCDTFDRQWLANAKGASSSSSSSSSSGLSVAVTPRDLELVFTYLEVQSARTTATWTSSTTKATTTKAPPPSSSSASSSHALQQVDALEGFDVAPSTIQRFFAEECRLPIAPKTPTTAANNKNLATKPQPQGTHPLFALSPGVTSNDANTIRQYYCERRRGANFDLPFTHVVRLAEERARLAAVSPTPAPSPATTAAGGGFHSLAETSSPAVPAPLLLASSTHHAYNAAEFPMPFVVREGAVLPRWIRHPPTNMNNNNKDATTQSSSSPTRHQQHNLEIAEAMYRREVTKAELIKTQLYEMALLRRTVLEHGDVKMQQQVAAHGGDGREGGAGGIEESGATVKNVTKSELRNL